MTLNMQRGPGVAIEPGDVIDVETLDDARDAVAQADDAVQLADVWDGTFHVATWDRLTGWQS